jgi:hypothetical protein
MNREVHVRFCESAGVKFPCATRPYIRPPYITTDHRWSGRGGAGRKPEDAGEEPPDDFAFGDFGFFGQQELATVQVPNVKGLSLPVAEMQIAMIGLRVGMVNKQYSNEVPENTVIGQSPGVGMTVFKDMEIHLVVSLGPQ